jgi:hypothetical protein
MCMRVVASIIFRRISMCIMRLIMRMPDFMFSYVSSHENSPAIAMIDDNNCTNRVNLLLLLYWDDDIQGISINDLRLLRGDIIIITMHSDDFIYTVDMVQNKCNDEDILFNELVLNRPIV